MLVQCMLLPMMVVQGILCLKNSRFVQEEMCNVEESIQRGCSKEVPGTRSALECVIQCQHDTECVGASLYVQGICLHHQLCHFSVPCPAPDTSTGPDTSTHRYMVGYCVHGTWDSSTQSCACEYETSGKRCNKYIKDCGELITSGYKSANYLVILDPMGDGTSLLKLSCKLNPPTTYKIRLLVNTGRIDSNRTWNDYVNGFVIDKGNHWAAWNYFSQTGKQAVSLFIGVEGSGSHIATYSDVVVANAANNYSFTGRYENSYKAGAPPGDYTFGDCLSPLQGVSFSTWDRDQDGSVEENCASLAGSGWWYKGGNCDNPCNLLGWGLDNYDATPPHQRLTLLGIDKSSVASDITGIYLVLEVTM